MQSRVDNYFKALFVGVFVLLGAAYAQEAKTETRLLAGFEDERDMEKFEWRTSVKLVAERASEGKKCVKVTFSGEKTNWPGFGFQEEHLSGWGKYDIFVFDVYNPADKIETFNIRIDDPQSKDNVPEEWTTWYCRGFKALPGKNRFKVELAQMLTAKIKRKIDASKLTRASLYMDFRKRPKGDKSVLYFDNFRLEKFPTAKFPASLKAFDFGPPECRIWPGFTGVTKDAAYSDKDGFGFTKGDSFKCRDYKLPDDIGRDHVRNYADEFVFSVKAGKGKYRVWVVVGNLGVHGWPQEVYTVSAEGKEIFSFKPKSGTYLGNIDHTRDFSRSAMLWDLYAADRFQDIEFEVECADGRLDIGFAPGKNVRLCALTVWPAGEVESGKMIAGVKEARKKQFNTHFREAKPVSLPKPPKFGRDEKACGFMLVRCNYLEDVSLYSVPELSERLKKLSIAACPGEYEPAVFLIYPERDVRGVDVKVSDLEGKGGKIPSSRIQIACPVYAHAPSGNTFTLQTAQLLPRAKIDLEKGLTRQFWLTVKVPDDAKGGTYKGTVTVSANGEKLEVPFELEIYPFKLDLHNVTYAHVYCVPKNEKRLEQDLRCLVEHGMNSVTANEPGKPLKREGGLVVPNFERTDMLMKVMKKVGMTGPVPLFAMSIQGSAGAKTYTHLGFERTFGYKVTDPKYLEDLTDLTKAILRHAKENDWLPVIMYPSTEASNDVRLGPQFQRKLVNAIRKAGKVVCVASVNTPRDVESVKDLDIIMYNAGVPINEKSVKAAHDAGCKLWFQNIGGTRFNEGLYLLRTGAVGRRQWVLNMYAADPYNNFQYEPWNMSFPQNSGNLMFPSPIGTLPSVRLERMREGVDDYRYFITLKHLIERAEKEGKAKRAAAKAKADYDKMIASCPIEMNRRLPVGRDGFVVNKGFRDLSTFNRYRSCVAGHIAKLKKELE